MLKKFKNNDRNILSIKISFLIFIFIFAVGNTNFLYSLNKKIQNTYYGIYNESRGNNISDKIVIIEIDNKTLEQGEELGRFPFDRKSYIPIIERLNESGAAIIAFDMIFTELSNSNSDLLFSNSIKKAGNVIIGSYFSKDDGGNIKFNESIFSENILSTGFFTPIIDPINHVVYSLFPFGEGYDGNIYNHFSLTLIKEYYTFIYSDKSLFYDYDNDYYYLKSLKNNSIIRKIPFEGKGNNELLINFIKNNIYLQKRTYSFIDIYDEKKFDVLKKSNANFKDKIVIIGASASGIKDIFFTPNGNEPGVYVHANMINTILTNSYLQYFDSKIEWLLIFVLIIFSVYFNLSRSGYILIASNIFVIITFLILFPLGLLLFTYVILTKSSELILAIFISLGVSNIAKYIIENENKTKLNKALSEYVSADVANEILSGTGKINLDGENKAIAIFFSDIEGFTGISEKFSPEELVGFLREYLSNMSDIIMDEKGFINKYEGDAIMALWGVFGEDLNKSYNVCLSALKQQELLKELNKKWTKKGFLEIKARIGIHLGDAIIGNIGSEGRKMEFTALGDSINLASRLEGVNKFYGTYICASESIYEIEKGNFEFRYIDKIKVQGKDIPVKIYELLGAKGDVPIDILRIKEEFEKAILLYLDRDFKKARTIFKRLIKKGDNAGKMYIDMCEIYIKTPPSDDWDGISTMTSK